jgi:PAS domain S-box-containing protein
MSTVGECVPGDAFKAADGPGRLVDLNASMDAYPDALRLLSLDGVIEYMNPAALRLSQMVDFELLRGRPWLMFWPEPAQAALKDAMARAAAGETVTFRAARRAAQGAQQWLDNTVSPVRDETGAVVRLMAVSRDVTDTIESEAFLETLVRRLPNPLIVKSARDGRYVLINRAAEEAFGVSADEWTGKTAFELFPQNEAELFAQEDADVVASRETRVSEEEAITTRNGVRHFTTKKFATYDGDRPLHLVTLGEDVTERREASEALKTALAEAEQANRAKSEFLANMSHEIRTPLNGIVAGADMLARCELDPRAKELAEIIATSAATLERLLSDVLDLARIEAGRITVESTAFHLGDLVRATAALAKLQADEKGLPLWVEIAPEVDAVFEGDPHRIRQVLVNLLSNAVKFTERGAVTLAAEPGSEGGVKVSVNDTGIGFKPELKDKIFGRFQQGDGSITRRFGGTGLGMTISRELIGLMGGILDAEGREGAGATFWFELPLHRAELSDAAQEERELQGPDRVLRVLLADDHPTNRKVVQLMLEGLAQVVLAENGREALIAYGAGPFDLVLMDMQMPVMDGLAATRRIRESERASGKPRTPVIMLTANALPEHVAASLAAGADRHLEKPVTLASLLEAMNDVLADRPGDEAAAATS